MGPKQIKAVAIIFIFLFSVYYQRWLILFFYELLFGDSVHRNDTQHHVAPELIPALSQNEISEDVSNNASFVKTSLKSVPGKYGKLNDLGDNQLGTFYTAVDGPNIFFDKEAEAEVLSAVVQYQLGVHQGFGCNFPKLSCGAPIECSLGCQIHHIMTCLMIAHSLNYTLVPDFTHWPYKDNPWDNLLEPVNSAKCQLEERSTSVVWGENEISLVQNGKSMSKLRQGIPISRSMGRKLKTTFSNPFLWWAGQFANFTVKYSASQKRALEELKRSMQFNSSPVVGIALRRRDKKGEKHKQLHSVDVHLEVAKKYFDGLKSPYTPRRVFIASDDKNLLKLARKRYRPPRWEILGTQLSSEPEDILKDIYLLSACDLVICSFSSDICRLTAELLDSRDISGARRVKSLNSKYLYLGKDMNRLKFIYP